MLRRLLESASYPRAAGRLNLSVMAAAFIIFGLSLVFQSHRWASTPAYHVLLLIFAAPVWGALFLASGLGMAAAAWKFRRLIVIVALTAAFTLTTGWMLSFIARYLTSPNTTPETWVSWAIFDFLLLKVAAGIDRPHGAVQEGAEIEVYRQAVDDALAVAAARQKSVLNRDLDSGAETLSDAVASACAAYALALHATVPAGAMPAGDPAKLALEEARNALLRAEEAYARATGQSPGARPP